MKGQVFSTDFIIALVIFIGVISFIFFEFNLMAVQNDEVQITNEINNLARQAAESLVSTPGVPSNWHNVSQSEIQSIGLLSGDKFSRDKINALQNLSYETIRTKLGIVGPDLDVLIDVQEFNGTEFESISNTGIPSNSTTKHVAVVQRYGQINPWARVSVTLSQGSVSDFVEFIPYNSAAFLVNTTGKVVTPFTQTDFEKGTILCWVKPQRTTTNRIFGVDLFRLDWNSPSYQFRNTATDAFTRNYPQLENKWVLVGVTWDSTNSSRKTFVEEHVFKATRTAVLPSNPIEIGASSEMYFDEVGIWNRSLTKSEILDLWDGGTGTFLDASKTFNSTSESFSTSLKAIYHLDDSTGATDAVDSSGNGNDGTYSGGTLGNGGFSFALPSRAPLNNDGYAFKSASSAGVTTPIITSEHSEGTFVGWVNFSSLGSNYILGTSGGNSFSLYMENPTTLTFRSTSVDATRLTIAPTEDQWYFVGFTWNNTESQRRLYFSGTQSTYGSTTSLPIYPLRVGGLHGSSSAAFDEVGIWNRTLSAAEIAELYNSGNGVFMQPTDTFVSSGLDYSEDLQAIYHFDEAGKTTAFDDSGQFNDGLYSGTVLTYQKGGKVT